MTRRERNRRFAMELRSRWHAERSPWEVGHPPTTWSTATDSLFQTAFLLLSEADKFIPLVSKQSPLFFCLLHQWKREEGGEGGGRLQEQRGREKRICSTELHRSTRLMSCVLGPQGLGVWAPLSYNTVDKKPRALPSGNLRGGVSRPGGKELRREGQNTQVRCSSTGPYTVQRLWPRSMHRRTMEQQYTLTAKGLNVPFFFNRTDYFAEQSCNAI